MDASSPPDGRRRFRGYAETAGAAGARVIAQVVAQRDRLADRLARIRSVVVVASGKGRVGKSAVTANLAAALARAGSRVGALDGDLSGPSLARMLGASAAPLEVGPEGVLPGVGAGGVRLVSMEMLLSSADAPLRWRGPGSEASLWRGTLETGAMRELISDVAWGDLDFLLIDLPPGTDRIERLLELVPEPDAILLVTTPSEAACRVVARSARLVREAALERVGLVINMAAHRCPCCGFESGLFAGEHVRSLLETCGVAAWGEIPFDPLLASRTDSGDPPLAAEVDSAAGRALAALAERVREECGR